MEENGRKAERTEVLLKNLSVYVSSISFWVFAFSWNYLLLDNLELVPRLGLGAALSWVVFLHVEATGMIIMTMMREKWQSEAREARAREALVREALAQAREALAEARADAREAQAQAREAQAEAREAQAQAREARAQETIRDLRRQLREARGEDANGVEDA